MTTIKGITLEAGLNPTYTRVNGKIVIKTQEEVDEAAYEWANALSEFLPKTNHNIRFYLKTQFYTDLTDPRIGAGPLVALHRLEYFYRTLETYLPEELRSSIRPMITVFHPTQLKLIKDTSLAEAAIKLAAADHDNRAMAEAFVQGYIVQGYAGNELFGSIPIEGDWSGRHLLADSLDIKVLACRAEYPANYDDAEADNILRLLRCGDISGISSHYRYDGLMHLLRHIHKVDTGIHLEVHVALSSLEDFDREVSIGLSHVLALPGVEGKTRPGSQYYVASKDMKKGQQVSYKDVSCRRATSQLETYLAIPASTELPMLLTQSVRQGGLLTRNNVTEIK